MAGDNKNPIAVVCGARPNFMKAAPLIWAANKAGVATRLIHTGQHYDEYMSDVFLKDFGLPQPHVHLGVGSGTHGEVTGRCLELVEPVLSDLKPSWVLVVGDVNSTLAAALAAVKLGIPTAHVEAGLRSFDRRMPEEINRVATDSICDLLFTTEPSAVFNLKREGRREQDVRLVGNVMIDTLERFVEAARGRRARATFGLDQRDYALATLHRPSNVDAPEELARLSDRLRRVATRIPVVFPVHPRTGKQLEKNRLLAELTSQEGLFLCDPLGYIDFLSLMASARVVLTDSGGIQEETTVLGVPCLTLRDNTERPITLEQGTNRLVGAGGENLADALDKVLESPMPSSRRPDLWDGHAAERIIAAIQEMKTGDTSK